MLSLLLVSAFSFIPTLFLQRSFADTTIYTVTNKIWINATGISPSGIGGTEFVQLELEISQAAEHDGTVHITANEGDRMFTPIESQEWLLFKDLTRSLTSDPTDYVEPASNMVSYFGFPFINGSLNCSPIANSYFESRMPATSFGSSIRETFLLFDAPAQYAAAYCTANGYTYQNVINSTYEQIINFNAINSYRSRLLETAMYTIEDTSLSVSSSSSNSTVSTEGVGNLLVLVGLCLFSGVIMMAGLMVGIDGTSASPPSPPPELDPPPATEIENMTIWAFETFGASVQVALEAYLNGTIDFVTYQAIVQQLGKLVFDGLNNSVVTLSDIWRDYYNTTAAMYDTYAKMYDNYLEGFSASWTDWLTLVLIIIVVIIVLVIVYKVISNKVSGSASAAQTIIVPK